MKIKINSYEVTTKKKEFKILQIEKRVPVWINPSACCPVCASTFEENNDKFASVIELENGQIEWVHETCLNK